MVEAVVGHIVAMGGGGFSMPEWGDALDDYVLSLAKTSSPKVCFVPTASGDADCYILRFYQAFTGPRAQASHLSLFRRTETDLCKFILDQEVLYVGGGNTANLLGIWRLHGLDVALREAWTNGKVICGISAGAICWFEQGLTDSFGPLSPLTGGLGFLAGSCCPHYDGEPERRPAYQRLIRDGALKAGIAIDDHAAVHFVGEKLVEVVAARAGAAAYRVSRDQGRLQEGELQARLLL